jgi:uncharacterized membrane protein
MSRFTSKRWVNFSVALAIAFPIFLLTIFSLNFADPSGDIKAIFQESARILAGENPYVRTLSGNMLDNNKYPTLLPLFYLLGSLTQLLGLRQFEKWVLPWRIIFAVCHLGIAAIVLSRFNRQNLVLLGIVGFWFCLLNRWALAVLSLTLTDPLALLALVGSVVLFDRRRVSALLLFGFSLAIKQVGIFLLPLYLIWVWQSAPRESVKKDLIQAILIILSIPVLVSLPFLIWHPEGFIQSILFSATRKPLGELLSIDAKLRAINSIKYLMTGITAKVFTLFLFGLTYVASWRYKLDRYTSSVLIFLIFTGFNSVYFPQYTYWVFPFLCLAILKLYRSADRLVNES